MCFFLLGDEVQQGWEAQVEVQVCSARILPAGGPEPCPWAQTMHVRLHEGIELVTAAPRLLVLLSLCWGQKDPEGLCFLGGALGFFLWLPFLSSPHPTVFGGDFPCAPSPFLLLQHSQDAVASARRLLPRGLVLSDLWCAGGGKTQVLSLQ